MKTTALLGVCILLLSASRLAAQTDATMPTRTIITPHAYPTKIESLGAGVNSSADDFAPAVIGQGRVIYFTTTRNGNQDVFSTSLSGSRWSGAASVGTAIVRRRSSVGIAAYPFRRLKSSRASRAAKRAFVRRYRGPSRRGSCMKR